ncbi:MAG: TlpA disulfide reductase family protein [Sulfurisoma sp.]|nr:TlpA disulfide reductase family protein [Sulfurisoma sp.]
MRHPRAAFALPLLAIVMTASAVAVAAAPDAELARKAGMEPYPTALRAPPLRLPSFGGPGNESRGAEDYKGRVVLLNFWASWCPPCREEFPSLERLQQKLGGKDFTVLAVSVSDSEDGIGRFLAGRKPVFDILMDNDGATAAAFRARGVPVTYLLDRQGRLLAGKTGPQHWDSPAMEELIRQTIAR